MKARIPQGQGRSMNEMLKQAKKMQKQAEELQEELDEREYSASAGGIVDVTVTGNHRIISLKIKPEAVNADDTEMLEDMIASAINQAISEATKVSDEEMEKVTSQLDLSGIPNMGGLL